MVFRLFLLGGHYRSKIDFPTAAVDAAEATLRRLLTRIQPLRPLPAVETLADAVANVGDDAAAARMLDAIDAAIAADLNTPKELAVLQGTLPDAAITPDPPRAVVAAGAPLLCLG